MSAVRTTRARGSLKIILGDNAVTKKFADQISTDAAAVDAVQGVEFCKSVIRT